MVVVVLLAYAIGAAFLDVWDMCIDTIFQVPLSSFLLLSSLEVIDTRVCEP